MAFPLRAIADHGQRQPQRPGITGSKARRTATDGNRNRSFSPATTAAQAI
jgi:hypothetical protein